MILEHCTWGDVKRARIGQKIILAPLGSFEQHGRHLPLTTDTDIITAIATRLEKKRPGKIVLLPTLWIGHSTHHLAFPGTLSVHQRQYCDLLLEMCGSIAGMGARKVFLLNGHGGNDVPARTALRELKDQYPATRFVFASYWSIAAKTIRAVRESKLGGIGHACELETSLMLHLHPDRVNMKLARRDGPRHADRFRLNDMQHARPVYFVNEFHEVSETGAIGHPDLATAAKGKRFLDGIVAEVAEFIAAFEKW